MSTHITLRQFRYFIAVAEGGSVASASRMLSIAQSALTSAEIYDIETHLPFDNITRSNRAPDKVRLRSRVLIDASALMFSPLGENGGYPLVLAR